MARAEARRDEAKGIKYYCCLAWKAARMVPALAMVALFTYILYGYMFYLLPNNYPVAYVPLKFFVNFVIACVLAFNLYFNYLMCWLCSAGVPPPNPPESLRQEEGLLANDNSDDDAPNFKHCRKCDRWKPARAHHCSFCGNCVLKMDHHCPWVANCVGHNNHRYFILFLFYLWTCCAYATATTSPRGGNGWVPEPQTQAHRDAGVVLNMNMFMPWMIMLSAALVIFFFLGFHLFLVLTAQTTIEFLGNWSDSREAAKEGRVWLNPYDLGYTENWNQFFGIDRWYKFVLPVRQQNIHNGIEWPRNPNLPPEESSSGSGVDEMVDVL